MEKFRQYHKVIWFVLNNQEKNVKFDKNRNRIHNPTGLKLLTRLRLGVSHFSDYKFNHNFRDCINPLYSCSLSVENNVHFFLHCHHFLLQRQTLMNNIKSIDKDIINATDSDLVNILLFGSSKYQYHINSKILSFSIDFILKTERFSGQPFWKLDSVNNANLWTHF